ncbi:MAG: APC family permease [Chloroflexi bacterium]|nr:APC family permease [Chloroflexota bacterium]
MIGGRQPLRGNKPGDRRVRVERPHAPYFRYTGKGVLTAKPAASAPTTPLGRGLARTRRAFIGRPLASEEELGERLPKTKALAIFSSDAISSSAYATEEILRSLLIAGVAALAFSLPVAIGVAILLSVVAISYRQVCMAYPTGGGSYSVSKANFGRLASLVAASALLIDYILTVAVSISSASEQIVAAIPDLRDFQVEIAVIAIVLVTLGNLRGLRESGNIFALPTYLFVGAAALMIGMGAWQILVDGQGTPAAATVAAAEDLAGVALVLLLLRAFASGAVALTGVEAIATGVPAFQPPEARNASTTLAVMAALLAFLFVGITFLASSFGVVPNSEVTVIAQVAGHVFGSGSLGYFLFLTFATLILILAANTSFNAFPRLAAILAADGFIPRQFGLRGDRLAFTTGILFLGGVAILLVIAFEGDTHALIPLYAVGVFIDFTISQSGMVKHWLRTRPKGYQYRLAINAFGATVTGIVALVVTGAKLPGSLVVVVLIPIFVGLMLLVSRQYQSMTAELAVKPEVVFGRPRRHERVVIPVANLSRPVVQAVQVGRSLSEDVQVVHVTDDREAGEALRLTFERQFPGVPFVIVESPYRSLVRPFVTYLDVTARQVDAMTMVIIPEYVARHWWEQLLYNQTAKRLRTALLGRPDTVVAAVPYRRGSTSIHSRGAEDQSHPATVDHDEAADAPGGEPRT